VALEVHLEIAGADQLGLVRFDARSPEQGFGACDQLLRVEGFRQVVVRTHLEADHLVGDLVARGEHDDRHLAQLADLLADRQPVDTRQHDVQDHEVGLELAELGHRLGAVSDALDLVALACQVEAGQLDDVNFVVDDQDLGAQWSAHSINRSPARQTDVVGT
jgi:hypothetical protein